MEITASNTRKNGLTLVELLVALAISGIIFFIIYVLYASMTRSTASISKISDLKSELKLCNNIMQDDISRTGLFIDSTSGILAMGSDSIIICSKDTLLDSSTVKYVINDNVLKRMSKKNNGGFQTRNLLKSPEQLSLIFKYYNESNLEESVPEKVHAISYTLKISFENPDYLGSDSLFIMNKIYVHNNILVSP